MSEDYAREHAARVAAEAEADGLRRDLAAVGKDRDDARRRAREATQTIIAAIGADGPQNIEEAAVRIVARLRHSEAARDEAEHITARLVKACECVTCRGSILPPMQCGYCIEREEPTKGMPQRPATTNLRERAERAEAERDLYRAALADAARGEAARCDTHHNGVLATQVHADGCGACDECVAGYEHREWTDTPHAAAIRRALKATEGER